MNLQRVIQEPRHMGHRITFLQLQPKRNKFLKSSALFLRMLYKCYTFVI